jgi:predicted Zn-dependent peptidase
VGDIIKERGDNKMQKRLILNNAMSNYARYGPQNPFSNVLSNEELEKLSPEEIRNNIAELLSYEHQVLYYGPKELAEVKAEITKYHNVPEKLKPVPPARVFPERQLDRTVYVVDYDMKQAEIVMLTNGDSYKADMVPLITLYNNYFGGGMSSILFQDLRESKALAYSTFSRYNQPNKRYKKYYNFSYIGSQADKLGEAMKGLSDLLNDMPRAESSFSASRELILQEMRTQRINRADVLFNYLDAQELGNKTDIRKDIFEKVQQYKFEDIRQFHEQNIKGKPATVLVLGKKQALDTNILSGYGTVKFLTLEEVFGY